MTGSNIDPSLLAGAAPTFDAWRHVGDFEYETTITLASLGGKNVLYDPWSNPILNSDLVPDWENNEDGQNIVGWTVNVCVPQGMAKLYLENT
jgi:hypothetical protein